MKTNPLRVTALLPLLAAGCITEDYGPNSQDYYPQFPGESRLVAPQRIMEADGATNAPPQTEAVQLYAAQSKH